MTDTSATGRFWVCPKCHRHVSARIGACQCGFDRASQPDEIPEVSSHVSTPPSAPPPAGVAKGTWIWPASGGLLLLLAIGVFVASRQDSGRGQPPAEAIAPSRPPQTLPAQQQPPPPTTAAASEGAAQPSEMTPPGPIPSPGGTEIAGAAPASPAPPATLAAEGLTPSTIPQAVSPADAPPALSDTDQARVRGATEFEDEMKRLSKLADNADVAWHRYSEGCRQIVTTATASAGVGAVAGDRAWFALATASVVKTEWTEACAELGTFHALVIQVRQGMCHAEDRARRAWVYPGVRRDLRHKYRLQWEGWDSVCL